MLATKWSVTTGTAEDEASGLRKPAGHALELGGVAPDEGSELADRGGVGLVGGGAEVKNSNLHCAVVKFINNRHTS